MDFKCVDLYLSPKKLAVFDFEQILRVNYQNLYLEESEF